MTSRRLSARLEAVAEMVPEGCYLADIGSDHAFLPIALIQRGKISYAQAVENKTGPFLRMKGNVEDAGLSSHIQLTLADGLDELSQDANALALCGFGGLLTCEILEKNKQKLSSIRSIVCDPHRDLVAVRKKMVELGYFIKDEKIVYENKIFYTIIRFDKGIPDKLYSARDYYFGPVNRVKKTSAYLDWIEQTKKTVGQQLDKNLSKERRDYYLKLYRALSSELKGSEDR